MYMISDKLKADIVKKIKECRNTAKAWYESPFDECPFACECDVFCAEVFPKWWDKNKQFYKPVVGFTWSVERECCPCDKMGKHYVKRRIKKLFPELYRG